MRVTLIRPVKMNWKAISKLLAVASVVLVLANYTTHLLRSKHYASYCATILAELSVQVGRGRPLNEVAVKRIGAVYIAQVVLGQEIVPSTEIEKFVKVFLSGASAEDRLSATLRQDTRLRHHFRADRVYSCDIEVTPLTDGDMEFKLKPAAFKRLSTFGKMMYRGLDSGISEPFVFSMREMRVVEIESGPRGEISQDLIEQWAVQEVVNSMLLR